MTGPSTHEDAGSASEATLGSLLAELGRARNWQLWLLEGRPTDSWPEPGAEFTESFATALLDHLRWLERLESDGALVLSGPVDQDLSLGPSLSVFRAASREEATAMVANEPMAVAGYRTNSVRSWTVNEGSISVRVDLFADRFSL
jgi:uncharacterized protein YciI